MQGTVKWFNDTKGFGFITPSDGSSDLFVHYSDIAGTGRRSLREGDTVEYEPSQGEKGPKATNVQVIETEASGVEPSNS
ncbi:MAG: cold-shock protein [Phycisphaerales bacterium]|nr:MAG: cold-shock protein [Phycisphaerales bacterium]